MSNLYESSLSLQRAGPTQNLNEVALHASVKLGDQKSEELYSVHVEKAMEWQQEAFSTTSLKSNIISL